MTDTQLNNLKSDALETLGSIDTDKLTKEQYILFGASIAILDHKPESIQADNESDVQTILESKSESVTKDLIAGIKEELKDGEKWLEEFRLSGDRDYIQMSYDESTHAQKLIRIAQENNFEVGCEVNWLRDLQERISRL